jgi:putative (di)nucleoside polyphosphate hydrolase
MSFAPSRQLVGSDGQRWRCCAGAAIVNSLGHLLVGERIKIPGAWNCPQGGIDAEAAAHAGPESALEAAAREAFEEVGLRVGVHIVPIAIMSDEAAVKYEAGGWLKKEGFAGQALHWALFGCCDAVGDADAAAMCDLSGHGGESAEFSSVRWQPMDEVVASMWEMKRAPYAALQQWATPLLDEWRASAVARVDLSGTWARDASRNLRLEEALLARGINSAAAKVEATRPYVQAWAKGGDGGSGVWRVTTFGEDGVSVKRSLEYALGEWEESYPAGSLLFGQGPGTLRRRTGWLPMPAGGSLPLRGGMAEGGATEAGADEPTYPTALPATPPRVAHTTWTTRTDGGRGGTEVVMRFLRTEGGGTAADGESVLVVRRQFGAPGGEAAPVSEETFVRRTHAKPVAPEADGTRKRKTTEG